MLDLFFVRQAHPDAIPTNVMMCMIDMTMTLTLPRNKDCHTIP